MVRNVLVGTIVLFAASVVLADAKSDVQGAAKALADKANYSWKSTPTNAGGGGGGGGGGGRRGGGGGPVDGVTEKGGYTVLTMTRQDAKSQVVLKDGKGAYQTQDGWMSLAEGAQQEGFAANIARRYQTFKTPSAEAEALAAKTKELKKDGDAYVGDLTEEAAKELMSFGGGRGGQAPQISGAKGTAKFWVKDGVLAKYETKVQGTISRNENDIQIDRTTTVEIKDVGTTKVEVPEEGKKKAA